MKVKFMEVEPVKVKVTEDRIGAAADTPDGVGVVVAVDKIPCLADGGGPLASMVEVDSGVMYFKFGVTGGWERLPREGFGQWVSGQGKFGVRD